MINFELNRWTGKIFRGVYLTDYHPLCLALTPAARNPQGGKKLSSLFGAEVVLSRQRRSLNT